LKDSISDYVKPTIADPSSSIPSVDIEKREDETVIAYTNDDNPVCDAEVEAPNDANLQDKENSFTNGVSIDEEDVEDKEQKEMTLFNQEPECNESVQSGEQTNPEISLFLASDADDFQSSIDKTKEENTTITKDEFISQSYNESMPESQVAESQELKDPAASGSDDHSGDSLNHSMSKVSKELQLEDVHSSEPVTIRKIVNSDNAESEEDNQEADHFVDSDIGYTQAPAADMLTSSNPLESPTEAFMPTEAWLQMVKAELPLLTITRLLKHLAPQLETFSQRGNISESQVLEFIQNTTLVGLLPVPHPIVVRKYHPNKYTSIWFSTFQVYPFIITNSFLCLFILMYVLVVGYNIYTKPGVIYSFIKQI
jgi:hypothetical protein